MFKTLSRRSVLTGLAPAAGLAFRTPLGAAQAATAAPMFFDVRNYGVSSDGSSLATAAIQAAIDACARSGGGTVVFPAGRYRSGTIVLKSNVTLQLEAGAVLLGSRELSDYPSHVAAIRSYTDNYTERSLIYAEDAANIAITGRGTLDGEGASFKGPYKVRPYMIRVINCRNVSVSGVTILNSPMWVQHYMACEGVDIRGVTVVSRVNANNDGIDIDSSRRVRISDCDISSGDDAIVLKATLDRPCRDVTVTNCTLSTACNALKLGTESNGGFENIAISNCTVYDTRLAGIAVEMVDGGALGRVDISGIVMNGVGTPIFVRLGDRGRPFIAGSARSACGTLNGVTISNVRATACGPVGCSITGIPGHYAEQIILDNIRCEFVGGGGAEAARRAIEERTEAYPEFKMFGTLPAYGFYVRHARNVTMARVSTAFAKPDLRPALVTDDVENLLVTDAVFDSASGAGAAVRFNDTREAVVRGCRAPGAPDAWLSVAGAQSRNIKVDGKEMSGGA
jgi:polygalacturonase